MTDLQVDEKHRCCSRAVRLEPLVHWGTVIPAAPSQSVVFFHRNGELMNLSEYVQLVRNLVNTKAATYCTDCVEYLFSRRKEARETMTLLQEFRRGFTDYKSSTMDVSAPCSIRSPSSADSQPTSSQVQLRTSSSSGKVSQDLEHQFQDRSLTFSSHFLNTTGLRTSLRIPKAHCHLLAGKSKMCYG